MNILITGAGGFVGKNLTEALKNIRDGKDRTRPELRIEELFCYTRQSTEAELEHWCGAADFVFHLAGVNRPTNPQEFYTGNSDFTEHLTAVLRQVNPGCPLMLSSSAQASLLGRYADGEYGKSKRRAEEIVFSYGEQTGAPVYVYRFPNLFGKWCRPNYNSAVATFCHHTANDLPITVNDPTTELELLYIDDLVAEMLCLLSGGAHRCEYRELAPIPVADGRFCYVPSGHRVTLGAVTALLEEFKQQPQSLRMPSIPDGSFAKKLYSTYLSYLPAEKAVFTLKTNADERGSFTELLKTAGCGQFSVNISAPGVTKGQHWHHSKWEFFIVVSGRALIQERKIGSEEIWEFEVSGDRIRAVHMLPGYTHNIINLSDTEQLVTLMWANESFDPTHPDTFYEKV